MTIGVPKVRIFYDSEGKAVLFKPKKKRFDNDDFDDDFGEKFYEELDDYPDDDSGQGSDDDSGQGSDDDSGEDSENELVDEFETIFEFEKIKVVRVKIEYEEEKEFDKVVEYDDEEVFDNGVEKKKEKLFGNGVQKKKEKVFINIKGFENEKNIKGFENEKNIKGFENEKNIKGFENEKKVGQVSEAKCENTDFFFNERVKSQNPVCFDFDDDDDDIRKYFPSTPTIPIIPENKDEKNGDNDWHDLFDVLHREGVIFVGREMTMKFANKVVALMVYLDLHNDPNRTPTVFINSPGGFIFAGLAIYDTIQLLNSVNTVQTIVMGIAASMASVVLIGGDIRVAFTSARVMIHQPRMKAFEDESSQVMLESRILVDLRHIITEIYERRTAKPYWVIALDLECDKFLSATEARDYGIVDGVAPRRTDDDVFDEMF